MNSLQTKSETLATNRKEVRVFLYLKGLFESMRACARVYVCVHKC